MFKKLTPLLIFLLFLFPQPAGAHPADMYFHTFEVNLGTEGVQIFWEFVPGPMVAHVVWADADTNGDERISDAEARAWITPLLKVFSLELDGTPLNFDLIGVEWASSVPELRTGESPIIMEVYAAYELSDTPRDLLIINDFNAPNSLNWFNLHAEGASFAAPEQDNGLLKAQIYLGEGAEAWESGMPSIPPVVEALGLGETAEEAAAQAENKQGFLAILEGFLRTPNLSPLIFLASLIIALILGALHALSPGHGKTIVAAYLVGSQGKAYHAIALGFLVTLTHTGSVFILGLATLSLSQYMMPDQIFPMLELVSGLLIVILGFTLLLPRLKSFLAEQRRIKAPVIAKKVEKSEKGTRLKIGEEIKEPGPEHNHDPSQFGYIPIPTGATEASTNPLAGISWRSLIALGISGGLVPCPDAIAILLIAITINKIVFGLSLIISFSLGLAVVLIAIGIVMVKSKQIFSRLRWFSKASFIVPVISAVVVLALGAVLSFNALKNFPADFKLFDKESFLDSASVIYIAVDDAYHKQLYLIPANGGEVQQITNGEYGVWNYSVSAEGNSLIYATPDGGTGSSLWYWDSTLRHPREIFQCPEESCADVLWSPGREQILYSRLNFEEQQAYLGIPSLWWLDLKSGKTQPLFRDAQLPGFNPRWSYDGNWLSYTSASPQEIQIYHLKDGVRQRIPTEVGGAVVWSPNTMQFLIADLQFLGDMYLSKISLYDLESESLIPYPSEELYDDNTPTWSPDGTQIAFARGEWVSRSAPAEDQLWLMDADGENQHPLTDQADTTHGPAAWSPDGRYLLYRVYVASNAESPSQIRIFDLEKREEITLIAPGENPSWFLP